MSKTEYQVGDKLVRAIFDRYGKGAQLTEVTVEKVNKTTYTLDNGERPKKDNLLIRRGTWDEPIEFYPIEHPRIQEAIWLNKLFRRLTNFERSVKTYVDDIRSAATERQPLPLGLDDIEAAQAELVSHLAKQRPNSEDD